jgi:hypothetical protein
VQAKKLPLEEKGDRSIGAVKWKSDRDRSRYYKLRSDALELKNALAREQYVHRDRIKDDLIKFCAAINARVQSSQLDASLKGEIADDITSYLSRVHIGGSNGQANGSRGRSRRHRRGKAKI